MDKLFADIVVVGGGAAGLAAAVSAAENGADTLVIESAAATGGNGLFPMGMYAVGSELQRKMLIHTDAEKAFLECMEYSHWRLEARLVRRLIDLSGDTISWLTSQGVGFSGIARHYPNQCPEVFHVAEGAERTGKTVVTALLKSCEKLGVRILTRTRARRIILDGGAVAAVEADTRDGKLLIAGKRFIIATGGFAGNNELIRRFYPDYVPENHLRLMGIRHKGDGVTMAMEAGADIEGRFAMEMAAPKIDGYTPLNLFLGKPYPLWLNKQGERFTRESNVYDFSMSAQACQRQLDGAVFVMLDEGVRRRILSDGRGMLESFLPPDCEERLDETIDAAVKSGVMAKADSPAEMAEFIGVDSRKLEETIGEYNAFCAAGRDAHYAKLPSDLIPIENPPYYVIRAGVDMLTTHGGIRVNHKMEALNAKREPIPGLYVAGIDMGGLDADVYNMRMSGHAFGFAIVSGRIAGKESASNPD